MYRPTGGAKYGTYAPALQTMGPVSEFLNNDGNYHYIQVTSDPLKVGSGYVIQISNHRSQEFYLEIIDYTNTLTEGKAVLYGIK